MLDRGSTNDVKIKLRDGVIVANKDILMARSDYFAAMLSNNKFVEGETGSVDISYCSKLVMEKIVKFLFSGEVSFDQMSLAHHLELIHMTDKMLLTEFKHKVEDFVVNKIESNEETVEVSALHRLEAFMVWLSENEVTEEQKKEIVESFTFEEFSADILKKKDQLLKEKEKKINELRKTIEVTTKYPIPPYPKY